MPAKPKILSPLEQRLALYGFAFVQVAPGTSIDPDTWGLPELQLLKPHKHGKEWKTIFGSCRKFDQSNRAPVISPSLTSLNRIRRQDPYRPLVFCQTAFQRKPKPQTLKRLQIKKSPVTRLLAGTDGTDALYWINHWPEPEPVWVEALKGRTVHPLAALAQSQQTRNPHHQFWLREDGRLVEQLHLFHSYRPAPKKEVFSQERRNYDHQFKKQYKCVTGLTYVFSKKANTLKWFARDCRRLLGNRVCCWWYPALPDPGDPLIHFVLVKDSAIRFQQLPRPGNQVHMDGNGNNLAFRHIRLQGKSSCNWKSNRVPSARAIYVLQGKALVFWETNLGWISQETCQLPPKDRSEAFRQRAQTLALLFQTPASGF